MRFLRPAATIAGLLVMAATATFANPILDSLTSWVVFAFNTRVLEIHSAAAIIGNVGSSNNAAVPYAQIVAPEPAAMAFLATGLVALAGAGFIRRRRK